MSEYQYYEFLAIDRPLTADEMAELRALSTRAMITSVNFTNEYNWGDFKGNPDKLMQRYFDAHVYVANPLDKFVLGSRKLIEDLMIDRMAESDKIVTRYMADQEFQGAAFPILAREIFEAIRSKDERDFRG